MRVKKITGVLLLAALLLQGGCGHIREQKRYEAQFLDLFDTVTQVVAYADTKEDFEKQAEFIRDTLREYHELYDIYNDYKGVSNIKTINDNAGIKPVKVDRRIIDLLLFGKRMYEETGGRVNIAFGSVLSLWHDYRTRGIHNPAEAKLPPAGTLKEAAAHTDISGVKIDERASTVYLSDPLMSLDVGAIGKGYATEQAAQAAGKRGMDRFLLSVGGNIRASGLKEGAVPWRIGIENPEGGGDFVCRVDMKDEALVTSGDYQRYYTVDGKQYCHIIHPHTLMPPDYFRSVSVLCRDSGRADALSTALFNMTVKEGRQLVETLSDVEAVWIGKDGNLQYSSGLSSRLADNNE